MAKQYLSQVAGTQSRPLVYQGRLPEENVRIFIGNKKLTSINKTKAHEMFTQELTLNALIKQGRLNQYPGRLGSS